MEKEYEVRVALVDRDTSMVISRNEDLSCDLRTNPDVPSVSQVNALDIVQGSAKLKDVQNDIVNLKQDSASLSRSVGDDIKTNITTTAKRAQSYGTEKYENLQEGVRKKPMTSIGLAFGAGLLVSALLKGARK